MLVSTIKAPATGELRHYDPDHEMVADGRMPKPKRIDGRSVRDRLRLDEAFAGLDEAAAVNEWDRL